MIEWEQKVLEKVLDEAVLATHAHDEQKAAQRIRQLASASGEVVDVMVKALRQSDKLRQALAIRVLHLIGYPQNESAISELMYHIGDPNLPGREEAVETLTDMGPDVVVPHLVHALLEKGPPYHTDMGNNQTWTYDVEGLCTMLSMRTITSEYARRCCPAIYYLLSQADVTQQTTMSPDVDLLLDVVEKAGDEVSYVLPALIALEKNYPESNVGKHARTIISAFPEEAVANYVFLLRQL